MDALELLANNLANAATSGYKSDSEYYGLFVGEDSDGGTELPLVQSQWTDFTQGTVETTGNPLNIAISGRGFLAVNGRNGPLYTRNGSLRISPSGELVSADGYAVRATGGEAIRVTSTRPIEISTDGSVHQDGQLIGQLEIVDFKSTSSLKKLSGAFFQNSDPKNTPVAATNVSIEQGKLEGSNVAVPEAAMRMVGMMRQFEMLQKTALTDGEMNRKAIEEVARV